MLAVINIDLDPTLFEIGNFAITWHGIFSVLGILAAARMGAWVISRDGIPADRIYDAAVWMVIVGLIGARLMFVWENYNRLFAGRPIAILYINEGGISQWGGLFGAIVGALLWSLWNKVSFWKVIDGSGLGAMIGLFIGRIGDVINGEHHGTITNVPWAFRYVHFPPNCGRHCTLGNAPGPDGVIPAVHPEVAYEMLLCLFLLAVFLPLHRRLKAVLPDGVTGLLTLGLYGIGRFFLSYYRADPLWVFNLRQAQVASLAMAALAAVTIPLLIYLARRTRSTTPAAA
jgi:phosphatidylglycerol:prolipoprotein diacylglycerol transferase